MQAGATDPRRLEARSEVDARGLRPRDFFWDSIVLYVVGVIIGLTAIDVVTEYIRGSAVECFSPNGTDINLNVSDLLIVNNIYRYINNFCSASLPITEYFTAFIFVHGILIAAPHYLWLNHCGGNVNFFFQLVSSLKRLKDDKTGRYPDSNVTIVRELEIAFKTYKRNEIFWFYFWKLILQWLFSVAGLVVIFVYFTDFDPTFQCPRSIPETANKNWPIPGQQVTCVFKSLQLLEVIRIADIILLFIVVLGLTWAVLWVVGSHSQELGYKDVALFSFQSGLEPKYFVPNIPIPRCCLCLRGVLYKFFKFPWFGSPSISTSDDMGFLMMMLFRTDGGLGHVVKEVQVQAEIQNLNDGSLGRLNLHRRDLLYRTSEEKSDLKWQFEKGPDKYRDGVYDGEQWELIHYKDTDHLVLPDSFRGAVLGFASFAYHNQGALYVSFGPPTMGIATALARVFQRVGHIHFSPLYRDPDPKAEKIKYERLTSNLVRVFCPDNLLIGEDYGQLLELKFVDEQQQQQPSESQPQPSESQPQPSESQPQPSESQPQLLASESQPQPSKTVEIWKPGIAAGTFREGDTIMKTDFIVIGPLDDEIQKITVDLLLEQIQDYLSKDVILLSVYPLEISGKNVCKDFKPYLPPDKYFEEFRHTAAINPEVEGELPWPTAPNPDNNPAQRAKRPTSAASPMPPSLELQPAPSIQPEIEDDVSDPSETDRLVGAEEGTSKQPKQREERKEPERKTYSDLSVVVGDRSHSLFKFTLRQWKKPTPVQN